MMDRSEKVLDASFAKRMEAYFTRTASGRNRTFRIVPALFVSSELTAAVQAADICLYCINWGFRPPAWGTLDTRTEISTEFGPKLSRLQCEGDGFQDGRVFRSRGITLVTDPYGSDT